MCVNGLKIATIQFVVPENDIADTKIMFLGQLEAILWSKMEIWQPCNTKCGNPVHRTVSILLPFDFPCSTTLIRTSKSRFYHVYYESYGEIRKFGNSVIQNLATLFSDGFKIAPIRFLVSENIFVDTKIMFIGQLGDKL